MRGYPNDKHLIELLSEHGGVSPELARMLYDTGYINDDNIFVAEDYGKLVSVVCMTEYPYNFGKSTLNYLFFGTTSAPYRGRKIYTFLIRECLLSLCRDGKPFCGVIPASQSLSEFYKKLGFVNAFSVVKNEYTVFPDSNLSVSRVTDPDSVYGIYRRFFENKPLCVYKTRSKFISAFKEYELRKEKGGLYSVGYGMAFLTFDGNKVTVREYAGIDEASLVGALYAKFGKTVVIESIPEESGETVGMIRISSVSDFAYYAAREAKFDFAFDVRDSIVPSNNRKIAVCGTSYDDSYDGEAESISVSELAEYACKNGYMNVMLN